MDSHVRRCRMNIELSGSIRSGEAIEEITIPGKMKIIAFVFDNEVDFALFEFDNQLFDDEDHFKHVILYSRISNKKMKGQVNKLKFIV